MQEIKSIVREYFLLQKGDQIENPDQLIFVGKILINDTEFQVYFKNKTLKHFIERRKEDLGKRNSSEKSLEIIFKMINDLGEVLLSYTTCIVNTDRKNSFVVSKIFEDPLKTPLTVVLEKEEINQIIISYFFTKR